MDQLSEGLRKLILAGIGAVAATKEKSERILDELVKKGEDILRELCLQIEEQNPVSLPELYELTHAATDKFNELQEEFDEQGSEIETAARDCIATDFEAIAKAYGFDDADTEDLVATRDW